MEIHEAFELKTKYLSDYTSSFVDGEVRGGRARAAVQAVTQAVTEARPSDRLAIGISLGDRLSKRHDSPAQLEIRVQRTDGPAFYEARRIFEEVRGEARIVILERLEFPTYRSLVQGLKTLFRDTNPNLPLRIGDAVRRNRAGPGSLGGFLISSQGAALLSSSHVLAAYASSEDGLKPAMLTRRFTVRPE